MFCKQLRQQQVAQPPPTLLLFCHKQANESRETRLLSATLFMPECLNSGLTLRITAEMADVTPGAEANVLSWMMGPSSDDDQIERFTPSTWRNS